jgi:pyrroline-5-carboxylate reductase
VSGLSIEVLQGKIGDGNHAMRIMPNIASRFGESATCISFSENNKAQAQAVITLFEDLGTAPVIDEKLMDAATVLQRVEQLCPAIYKSIDAGWYRNRV